MQLSGLQDQVQAKEQLVATQSSQIEQGSAQRRNLEEMLAACKQHVKNLEDKFAFSAQEINKGNEIIRTLHEGNKQLKVRTRGGGCSGRFVRSLIRGGSRADMSRERGPRVNLYKHLRSGLAVGR